MGATYLLLTVILIGGQFVLLYALTRDGDTIDGFFPFGLIICTWGLVSLMHIVVCIVGLVRASKNRIFSAPAIPFFRA